MLKKINNGKFRNPKDFCDYQLKGKKINNKIMDAMGTDILTFILTIHKY